MSAITITIPAIAPEAIADLEQLTTQAFESEVAALRSLRETYAPLARHNGFIKVGYWKRGTQNWSDSQEYFYRMPDGVRARGLRVIDEFGKANTSEFKGTFTGRRLYLLESGQWLEISRDGAWSDYQNSPDYWTCDPDGFGDDNWAEETFHGDIRIVNDEYVAKSYQLADVLEELGKSLSGLAQRIPERMVKVRQRAELARTVITAVTRKGD